MVKDNRLELLLVSVREIDDRVEMLVDLVNRLLQQRQRLIAYEEHGIGFAGTASYEDGPEAQK